MISENESSFENYGLGTSTVCDESQIVQSIRQIQVYDSQYKHAAKHFEFPTFDTLMSSDSVLGGMGNVAPGKSHLRQIAKLEFNASYSIRGLQARFSDGTVSPYFGTPHTQLSTVFVK